MLMYLGGIPGLPQGLANGLFLLGKLSQDTLVGDRVVDDFRQDMGCRWDFFLGRHFSPHSQGTRFENISVPKHLKRIHSRLRKSAISYSKRNDSQFEWIFGKDDIVYAARKNDLLALFINAS